MSLLAPRRFGSFWFASLLSNIGTWAQQVAVTWLLLRPPPARLSEGRGRSPGFRRRKRRERRSGGHRSHGRRSFCYTLATGRPKRRPWGLRGSPRFSRAAGTSDGAGYRVRTDDIQLGKTKRAASGRNGQCQVVENTSRGVTWTSSPLRRSGGKSGGKTRWRKARKCVVQSVSRPG